MNFLPLCTAMVWPTISGTIVDRRDHVLITLFSFRSLSTSTFFWRWPSTNGPFFRDRGIVPLFLGPAQLDPARPPYFLKPSYRSGYTVRMRAKRTDKPCSLSLRRFLHDHRPAWLAKTVQHLHR